MSLRIRAFLCWAEPDANRSGRSLAHSAASSARTASDGSKVASRSSCRPSASKLHGVMHQSRSTYLRKTGYPRASEIPRALRISPP
jgi:hypothetical protein